LSSIVSPLISLSLSIHPTIQQQYNNNNTTTTIMKYRDVIIDAIQELHDRSGSSIFAIKKVMKGKYPGKQWGNAIFVRAIKAGTDAGYFIQIKVIYITKQKNCTVPVS
jgi:linker histone H1 and H5 family